jgi:hypothetical protein
MLGVPNNFRRDQELRLDNTFLKAARTRAERSWLKKKLKNATLCDQIAGEVIPSRLDGEYNCQVILTMSMDVVDMAEFGRLAELLQVLTKPLFVFRLTDGKVERYSFALKRLSKADAGEVVVEEAHATPEYSVVIPDNNGEVWRSAVDFTRVRNRSDKLAAYREWSARAYIASRTHLYSKTSALLASARWYEADFAATVFDAYTDLERLAREAGKSRTLKDRTRINQAVRGILDRLDKTLQIQGNDDEAKT